MASAVPGVEIADDADALGIRRPDGEGRPFHAVDFAEVCAQSFEGPKVRSLGQQPDVQFPENRRESERVVGLLHAAGPFDTQAIVKESIVAEDGRLEEAGILTKDVDLPLRKFDNHLPTFRINRGYGFGPGLQTAQPESPFGIRVQSKDREWIAMLATAKGSDFFFAQHVRLS